MHLQWDNIFFINHDFGLTIRANDFYFILFIIVIGTHISIKVIITNSLNYYYKQLKKTLNIRHKVFK